MYVHIHPSGNHPTFIQHEPKQIKLDPEATVVTVWMRVASKKKQEPALPMPLILTCPAQDSGRARSEEPHWLDKSEVYNQLLRQCTGSKATQQRNSMTMLQTKW